MFKLIQRIRDAKVHLVCFYSEGAPHDEALDLSANKPLVTKAAGKSVDEIAWYTPRRLREEGFADYVKEYESTGLVSKNPGMSKIGFCAWRPLVILLELDKMRDGDILIYRDCNIQKYRRLGQYRGIRYIAQWMLHRCKFDFFVPREAEDLPLKCHAKTNILRELGDGHPFSFEFPLLIANMIIVRKSAQSIELLEEWKQACAHAPWINGEQYGELDPDFRWSTPEQSLLTVVIANWIRHGKHGISRDYPGVIFKRRRLYWPMKPRNYDYLKWLKKDQV